MNGGSLHPVSGMLVSPGNYIYTDEDGIYRGIEVKLAETMSSDPNGTYPTLKVSDACEHKNDQVDEEIDYLYGSWEVSEKD